MVAVLVAVLAVASLAGLRALGFPVVFSRVSDHRHDVSIRVPATWRVETSSRAGETTTDGGSSGEGEPYRIPEIHGESWAGGGTTHFDLEVLHPSAAVTSLVEAQRGWAEQTCHVMVGCDASAEARAVTVAGRQGLEQTLGEAPSIYVSTFIDGNAVVRFFGFSDGDPTGRDELRTLWLSTALRQ